jgi:hypothetical protein
VKVKVTAEIECSTYWGLFAALMGLASEVVLFRESILGDSQIDLTHREQTFSYRMVLPNLEDRALTNEEIKEYEYRRS